MTIRAVHSLGLKGGTLALPGTILTMKDEAEVNRLVALGAAIVVVEETPEPAPAVPTEEKPAVAKKK